MKKIKCTCEHEYQDKNLGKDFRWHNATRKSKGTEVVYRCTVCRKEK